MGSTSVLFDDRQVHLEHSEPAFFHDLNLDQVAAALLRGRDEYDLIETFADRMAAVRRRQRVAAEVRFPRFAQGWHLEAVRSYCEAILSLEGSLAAVEVVAAGLLRVHEYLTAYVASREFGVLQDWSTSLLERLHAVCYDLLIRGDKATAAPYAGEPDYSVDVTTLFERFRSGGNRTESPPRSRTDDRMNHVEAGILDLVARVHPDLFAELERFRTQTLEFPDPVIAAFDREIQFYLAYLDYIRPLRDAGLAFDYPRVSTDSKQTQVFDTFDIALAHKLVDERRDVVRNDVRLSGPERILVVSGPNQGGKTTLARTFGQLHYLAGLGCPVPGHDPTIFLPSGLFSHFEREEDIETLSGQLDAELRRLHAILEQATSDSVLILNEVLSSATLQDPYRHRPGARHDP